LPRKPFDKALWRAQAKAHLAAMPPSESVIRALRDQATDSPMDTLARTRPPDFAMTANNLLVELFVEELPPRR
jgi:hypothetical protein